MNKTGMHFHFRGGSEESLLNLLQAEGSHQHPRIQVSAVARWALKLGMPQAMGCPVEPLSISLVSTRLTGWCNPVFDAANQALQAQSCLSTACSSTMPRFDIEGRPARSVTPCCLGRELPGTPPPAGIARARRCAKGAGGTGSGGGGTGSPGAGGPPPNSTGVFFVFAFEKMTQTRPIFFTIKMSIQQSSIYKIVSFDLERIGYNSTTMVHHWDRHRKGPFLDIEKSDQVLVYIPVVYPMVSPICPRFSVNSAWYPCFEPPRM